LTEQINLPGGKSLIAGFAGFLLVFEDVISGKKLSELKGKFSLSFFSLSKASSSLFQKPILDIGCQRGNWF
jgi:hypothetical protein